MYSYWEHFNYGKYLAYILPLDHPRRIKIEKEINNIQQKLKEHGKEI